MDLSSLQGPDDLTGLSYAELEDLAVQIRKRILASVTVNGGHLGSNLGAVEATLAIHRVFDSPHDVILFDTGHQSYVHKMLTGRAAQFSSLRTSGGISGYPSRAESPHDWIENSHASTALSYAYGIAASLSLGYEPLVGRGGPSPRRVVAVVGDGALTGGMAYEALNNIGHRRLPIVIVWNDNGRSYAPTVSRLSTSLTKLRLNPSYMQARNRIKHVITELPKVGTLAAISLANISTALRETIEPRVFFEALGIRYAGPIDGHDIAEMEYAFSGAREWDGPIVVHVLTQKGRGYGPAEDDDIQCMHDLKVPQALNAIEGAVPISYTEVFSKEVVELGRSDPSIVVLTAAMGGPTGLLEFQEEFPERFFDVGIAEQHAVTAAAGMAMAGLKPVVAIYSTFLTRAFDQVNLDVGLHGLPVTFVLDRAGMTGDDGPSHHGVLDLVEMLAVPGMTIFAPSCTDELAIQLREALAVAGPASIRFPKTPGPARVRGEVGSGMSAHLVREGTGETVIIGIGKMVVPSLMAADLLKVEGIDCSVIDPRVIRPLDDQLALWCQSARVVVTVEDGLIHGGAGMYIALQLREAGVEAEVIHLGLPTQYIPHGRPDQILTDFGLDGLGIASAVRSRISEASSSNPS
ncbi:MAG: 1-deoxy-D-xylulose-5-phosphate synthase [Ferrimicrobium sp.]